jgi:mono/diheme cytochrome c family protein
VLGETERARAEGLYERLCAGCHGPLGRGDGPLARYLTVPPRDFVTQPFKWRSTPSGSRPTVEDVARTISRGVPGGVMPAFGPALGPSDRALLARYVLGLNPGAPAAGTPLRPLEPTERDARVLMERGQRTYERLQCGTCHGPALRGDGPNAALLTPRPYDMTRVPPRGGADVASVLRAIRTGIDGTSMPGFEGAADTDDLFGLALWVSARIPESVRVLRAPNDPGEPAWLTDAQAASLPAPPPSGLLRDPARAERERTFWRFPLEPQGAGPAHLTPAERSLHPDRCGRCHARQFAQFRTSVHANAMGPGVLGQLVDANPRDVVSCQSCHGPLSEQSPVVPAEASPASAAMAAPDAGVATAESPAHAGATANPVFDAELRPQGVVCAACHLRGRERFGPPQREGAHAALLPGSMYPLTRLSRHERGDFCAPCHQHTMADAVAGRPALNTVAEWIASPYFARGVQCQHCHMPDRDHTWRGAHDPEAVRQAVHVAARVRRVGGEASALVTVENVGAGHAFPGTTTPAAVLTLEWLDAAGRRVGVPVTDTIQRRLEWDGRALVERFDTRILPGEGRTLRATTRDPAARALRYTLVFRPDDFYEGFYEREIARSWRSERGRALLRAALEHARRSPFVVRTDVLPIE